MRADEIVMLSVYLGFMFFQGFFLILKTLTFGINSHGVYSEPYSWSWVAPPKEDIESGNLKTAITYVYRGKILSPHSYKIRITRILYYIFLPVLLIYYIIHTIGMVVGILTWFIGERIYTWGCKKVGDMIIHSCGYCVAVAFFVCNIYLAIEVVIIKVDIAFTMLRKICFLRKKRILLITLIKDILKLLEIFGIENTN